MSRSYWLPIIVAVGLTLANPEVGHSQGSHGSSQSQGATASSSTKPSDVMRPILPSAIHHDKQRVLMEPEADGQKPPPEYDRRNAEAQEKVAHWTPWFLVIATLEALATAAGVILVYFTLRYTRRTLAEQKLVTKATWAAVKEAKRNAKAAEDALADARQHTNLQLRPWIAVTVKNVGGVQFSEKGMHAYFEIALKNVGASPAIGVRLKAELRNWRIAREDAVRQYYASEFMKADETAEYGLVLLPNEVVIETRGMSIPREDFGAGYQGQTHLFPLLLISVVYRSEMIAARWAQTAKTIFISESGDGGGRCIVMETGDLPEGKISLRENGLCSRAS